jgi:uncharacterized membrane protein YvbJ
MKRCPFCGEKIFSDATECKHCDKSLSSSGQESAAKSSVDLDSWQGKTVPSWLMYLLVAAALFCVWVMLSQGCERANENTDPEEQSAFNLIENSALHANLE